MADDILTLNANNEMAVRVVETTGDNPAEGYNDVYTRDNNGNLAVRTTGGGGGGVPASVENSLSVLETMEPLSKTINTKTTLLLSDLLAMDVDGRPSYKEAGAMVFDQDGVIGIIDSTDGTNAVITTVYVAANMTGATAELTVAGWSSNAQTVNVSGVTTTNTVVVSPAPSSASDYGSDGIICTAQGNGTLTFECDTVPSNAITVNILIVG